MGKGPTGLALPIVVVGLGLACARSSWPDEPGVPVALAQSDNVQVSDTFAEALSLRRRSLNLPAPIVAPRYQAEIRTFAEDLQAGKTSVPGALRAVEAWGKVAFGRAVKTFAVDCSPATIELPSELVELPAAVISYASAHFRPRSLARDQCVVLVAALTGADAVTQQPL